MDIDSIKHLGTKTLTQEEYEALKRETKVFPYVFGTRWIGQLSKVDDNYSLTVFATGMRITAKLVDTDTGVVKLRIAYYDGIAEVERDFDSDILTKLSVKELYKYGIRFPEEDAYKVVKYLIKSEANAPVIRSYSKLGWSKDGDIKIFRGHHAFCADGIYKGLTYNGKRDLNPTGDLNKWLAMVKKEVLPSTAMTFVLMLGFGGSLLALLNERKDLSSIMFSLANRSSRGKSTSAALASSVQACPIINKGTMVSFHGTENAIQQFVSSECGGHTAVLDEVALSQSKEFNRLMYSICNGRSKMRLNGDASQKEVTEFNGIVLSTAEFSLIKEDTPNGIKARVFEIKDELTTSAENSDNIKACIYENYALAGEPFVRYLLQKGDEVFEDYEQDKKYLCDKCIEKKELSERILSKLATILLTSRYVNKIFDLGINEDEIVEYILDLERQVTTDLKPEERLLEIVRQEVVRNNSRYITESYVPSSCCGAIKTKGSQTEVQITEIVFEKMMEDYAILDYKSVLKKLKDDGLLLSEPDRLFKRVTLMKEVGRQKCYCFVLANSLQSQTTQPQKRDIEAELGEVDIFAEFTNAIIDN